MERTVRIVPKGTEEVKSVYEVIIPYENVTEIDKWVRCAMRMMPDQIIIKLQRGV